MSWDCSCRRGQLHHHPLSAICSSVLFFWPRWFSLILISRPYWLAISIERRRRYRSCFITSAQDSHNHLLVFLLSSVVDTPTNERANDPGLGTFPRKILSDIFCLRNQISQRRRKRTRMRRRRRTRTPPFLMVARFVLPWRYDDTRPLILLLFCSAVPAGWWVLPKTGFAECSFD